MTSAKRGRPPEPNKKTQVSISIDPALFEELKAGQRRERRDSFSDFCRVILEEGWRWYKLHHKIRSMKGGATSNA